MIELKRGGRVCVLVVREESLLGPPVTAYMQAGPEDVASAVVAGNPQITKLLNGAGWWQSSITTQRMRELERELYNVKNNFMDRNELHAEESRRMADLREPAIAADEIDEDPEETSAANTLDVTRARRAFEGAQQEVAQLRIELAAEKRRGDERVNAITDAAVPVSDLEEERRIVRRIVRASVDVMVAYLSEQSGINRRPIASSGLATALNDAIHDWVDCVGAGGWCNDQVEMKALEKQLEDRVLGKAPEPQAAPKFKAKKFEQVTDATKRSGFRWPPTDFFGQRIPLGMKPGQRVLDNAAARASLWLLERLW